MGRREAYLEDNEDLIRGKANARAPVQEVQGAFWRTKVSENQARARIVKVSFYALS